MKKFLSTCLIASQIIISDVMFATEESMPSGLHKIISDGYEIYAASIRLPTGEIAHFGCEPIVDKNRSRLWSNYRDVTGRLTDSDRGVLAFACKENFRDKALDYLFSSTQNHKEEIENLLSSLQDSKKMQQSLRGISSGRLGMHTEIGAYISYVCKKPITGFFELPQDNSVSAEDESKNLDGYIDNYNNLLISVSSYGLDRDEEEAGTKYEHRGIFRNPISMLRKDYPGLAVPLHSFTGLVWRTKSPNIEKMLVNPDGNDVMRSILLVHFKGKEGVSGEDREITVPVRVLAGPFENMLTR